MCHGTLLIVSTLAEFLGDCYDRVGSQVQDWPTGGETSFTRIYDGDIIKINEDDCVVDEDDDDDDKDYEDNMTTTTTTTMTT